MGCEFDVGIYSPLLVRFKTRLAKGPLLELADWTGFLTKLDRVGPVNNRPSTDKVPTLSEKKRRKKIHVTHDMWHVTRDTHVTCDMLWGVNILSKFQLPSSYCLWFMILWRSGGKGWRTDWINQWMNNEAVYRTAQATPGLLITYIRHTKLHPSPLSFVYHGQGTPPGLWNGVG